MNKSLVFKYHRLKIIVHLYRPITYQIKNNVAI